MLIFQVAINSSKRKIPKTVPVSKFDPYYFEEARR